MKKSTTMSATKLESGREELGRWAFCLFVFELIGCLRKKKKRKEDNPDVAKHNLTPVSFSFFSLFGYSPSDALFSLALFFAWLLSAALG